MQKLYEKASQHLADDRLGRKRCPGQEQQVDQSDKEGAGLFCCSFLHILRPEAAQATCSPSDKKSEDIPKDRAISDNLDSLRLLSPGKINTTQVSSTSTSSISVSPPTIRKGKEVSTAGGRGNVQYASPSSRPEKQQTTKGSTPPKTPTKSFWYEEQEERTVAERR
eukprot:752461-Hanusia_phi.AAC.3